MTVLTAAELADQIRAGSIRALARGLSWIEAGDEQADRLTEEL